MLIWDEPAIKPPDSRFPLVYCPTPIHQHHPHCCIAESKSTTHCLQSNFWVRSSIETRSVSIRRYDTHVGHEIIIAYCGVELTAKWSLFLPHGMLLLQLRRRSHRCLNELCIIGPYSVFHGPRQQLTTNVVMSAVIMDCWLLLPVVSKRTVYEVA